jgi:hypothetical protein
MTVETLQQSPQHETPAQPKSYERTEPFEQFESMREAALWFEDLALEVGQREVNITMGSDLTEDDFKETFHNLHTGPGRHVMRASPNALLLQQRKLDIPGRELDITVCDEVGAHRPERLHENGLTIDVNFADDAGGRFVAKIEQSFWGQDYKKGVRQGAGRGFSGTKVAVSYTTNEGMTEMMHTETKDADSHVGQGTTDEEYENAIKTLSTMRALILWRVRTMVPEATDALKDFHESDNIHRSAFAEAQLRKRGFILRSLATAGYAAPLR